MPSRHKERGALLRVTQLSRASLRRCPDLIPFASPICVYWCASVVDFVFSLRFHAEKKIYPVPGGTSRYEAVPAGTKRYQPVRSGTSRYEAVRPIRKGRVIRAAMTDSALRTPHSEFRTATHRAPCPVPSDSIVKDLAPPSNNFGLGGSALAQKILKRRYPSLSVAIRPTAR
jgi:hypothetical protein